MIQLTFYYLPFTVPNKKGVWEAKHIPGPLYRDYYKDPISFDPMKIQHPGYWFRRKFVYVPQMDPVLMVPDLEGFKLKPYVSYATKEIHQSELTALSLFNATYGQEIIGRYMKGEDVSLDITQEDIDAARQKYDQTGADLFDATEQELEAITP